MRILTFLDSRYIGDSIFLSKKVISLNICHFDVINIILLLKYQTEFQCLSQKEWPSIFHVAWNLWSNHLKNSMTRTILSHDWELLHQQASQNRRENIYIYIYFNAEYFFFIHISLPGQEQNESRFQSLRKGLFCDTVIHSSYIG